MADNFIEKIAIILRDSFLENNNDLSKIACVFGGRRPALFLRRSLSKIIQNSFLPPRIFSMDDFISYISEDFQQHKTNDLDNSFLIYSLVKKYVPSLLNGREQFSEFLSWSKEIISFIEQLDIEGINNQSLESIQKSAIIGYEVPNSINTLLKNIIILRNAYHDNLATKGIYSRSARYMYALNCLKEKRGEIKFKKVIFCNFFYLNNCEKQIIKEIYLSGKGVCVFQGLAKEWTVLRENLRFFNVTSKLDESNHSKPLISFYRGFDMHSQAGLVQEVFKSIQDKDDTVIVLPLSEVLLPLISEVSPLIKEFNISMGYPLKRSSAYALLEAVKKAQESKQKNKYYTNDYLALLRHPLVRNFHVGDNIVIVQVIIQKIEESLTGEKETSIGGSIFLGLDEIEKEKNIWLSASKILKRMKIDVSYSQCLDILVKIHNLFFRNWECFTNFQEFSISLDDFVSVIFNKSVTQSLPFEFKVANRIVAIKEEFENVSFGKENFPRKDIWSIFQQKLQGEKISFSGSPLRGTQILGFFETRSLTFKNVIIMDVNESILPRLKIYESLIPREVMLSLGLKRLEKEEEIQRYQFMRLVSSAENVHLIYEENKEKERSRFVEELIWEKQKETGKLHPVDIPRSVFSFRVSNRKVSIKKTPKTLQLLKKAVYSASRVNVYLKCPLRFYYQYVLGLKEKEDLLVDPLPKHIGTFIHQLLEEAFKIFVGRKPIINREFRQMFLKMLDEKFEKNLSPRMRADVFLLKQIIINRLENFLNHEAKRKVKKIICLEKEMHGEVKLSSGLVLFRYTIDRIDQVEENEWLVIDYKTGSNNSVPRNLKALLSMEYNRQSIKEILRSFQLPLYYYFVAQEFPKVSLNAVLYNIRTLKSTPFIAKEDINHRKKITGICLEALNCIFAEILNPNIDFFPDKEERNCVHCPFRQAC